MSIGVQYRAGLGGGGGEGGGDGEGGGGGGGRHEWTSAGELLLL